MGGNIAATIAPVNRHIYSDNPHNYAMDLSQRIKALRVARGMTQKALAKASGISQPSLSAIESGDTTILKAETVLGLCKALNSNPDYIIHGVGPMGPLVAVDIDVQEIQTIAGKLSQEDLAFLLITARALRDKTPSEPSAENPFVKKPRRANV